MAPLEADGRGFSDSTRWRAELYAGDLRLTHWGGLGRDAFVLADVLAEVLRAKKFRDDVIERTTVCLFELLTNVARHTAGPAAITLSIDTTQFRAVRIVCGDSGPGFDLHACLQSHIRLLESGVREHGLLKVSRLADTLGRVDYDSRHETRCEVHDFELPTTPFFTSDKILPFQLDFSRPSYRVWLGRTSYGESIYYSIGSEAVADLYFERLGNPRQPWIGVEFAGDGFNHTVASSDPERDLLAAICRSFPSHVAERRVLVNASAAGMKLHFAAAEWCRRLGFEFLDDDSSLARRIRLL